MSATEIAAEIARLAAALPAALAAEDWDGDAADVLGHLAAALEATAQIAAQAAVRPDRSTPDGLVAYLQAEQRYVERIRARQEADGLRPPLSGMPGHSAWRSHVVRDCRCETVRACPVHDGGGHDVG